jgi:hypothetical protein
MAILFFKRFYGFTLLVFSALILISVSCTEKKKATGSQDAEAAYYTADDFSSVEKIDNHIHIRIEDSTFIQNAAAYHFRLLNINVKSPTSPPLEEQQSIALKLINRYPEQVAYATTISVDDWEKTDWQSKTLDYLKESFRKGAVTVKIWKNVGMVLKDKNGKFVMIDDPRFDTILNYLEKNHIALIGHFGEPKNCWLPIEKMTVKGDKDYFLKHPQYHMYLHPEYPSYEDQINARDHMLEKHPGLLFVGAHLGSLEWSVDELARRLDKFPNMAVDMAERISHLQYQAVTDWQKVHDFFITYQDRLIYGTDQRVDSTKTADVRNKEAYDIWLRHWKFFTSDEKMRVPKVEHEFKGLKLPRQVIDKIYRENAKKWVPGL